MMPKMLKLSSKFDRHKMQIILSLYLIHLLIATVVASSDYFLLQAGQTVTILCPMLSDHYDTSVYNVRPNLVLVLPSTTASTNDVLRQDEIDLYNVNMRTNEYKTCPDRQPECLSILRRFEEPLERNTPGEGGGGGGAPGSKDKILFNLTAEFSDGGSRLECGSFDADAYKPPESGKSGSGSSMPSTTIITFDPEKVTIEVDAAATIGGDGVLRGRRLDATCGVTAKGGERLEQSGGAKTNIGLDLRWQLSQPRKLDISPSFAYNDYKTISVSDHILTPADHGQTLACILSYDGVDVGKTESQPLNVKFPPQRVEASVVYVNGKQRVKCEAIDFR